MSDRDLVTAEEAELSQRAAEARAQAKAERRPRKIKAVRKGKDGERVVVKFFAGWFGGVRRQPRSGSIEGLPHDVVIPSSGPPIGVEVKNYGKPIAKNLERLRDGADCLVTMTNGKDLRFHFTEDGLRALLDALNNDQL